MSFGQLQSFYSKIEEFQTKIIIGSRDVTYLKCTEAPQLEMRHFQTSSDHI
jgi:hypothetical protein